MTDNPQFPPLASHGVQTIDITLDPPPQPRMMSIYHDGQTRLGILTQAGGKSYCRLLATAPADSGDPEYQALDVTITEDVIEFDPKTAMWAELNPTQLWGALERMTKQSAVGVGASK